MSAPRIFGAILAGGRNVRYGALKALETVGGERIIDRARAALLHVAPELILIANDPDAYGELGLPMRPDAVPGLGALGGIHAALAWARDERRDGVVVIACDMPFVSPALLERLLRDAAEADVVVPESPGRRGVEPLCAFYSTACLPAIEAQIGRDDRRVIGFFDDVRVRRVPLDEVLGFGDPQILFMNVNTPEERARAEAVVHGDA
jgi:molybdopterin-guanine dinucleotide biosynthesis protein A